MVAPGDRPLTSEFKELLGSIVEQWAYVDGILNEILSKACSADPGSMYVITQSVSASSISSWVRTLLEVRFTPDANRQALLDLLSEIDTLRGRRNAAVHGFWTMDRDNESAILQTFKWERREVLNHELMTRPDMEELLADVVDVRRRLGNVAVAMGAINI
jgi:hypothetical protein